MLIPLTFGNFHHELAQTPGVSLVLFTGPACGACRRLKAELQAHGGLFGELRLFEVDAQREMGLVHEFEVFHLPAMFLFQEGEFHCELQSEPVAARLRAAIEQALTLPAEELP